MQSAAAYTNKIRVIATAKNTKVDYPGGVGRNHGNLQSAIRCNPNFTPINYFIGCRYYKGVTCLNPNPDN